MAKEEKKSKTEVAPSPRIVKAVTKHLRIAPRKMRLVIDTIRREQALEAVGILMLLKKKGARMAVKTMWPGAVIVECDENGKRLSNKIEG